MAAEMLLPVALVPPTAKAAAAAAAAADPMG